MPLLLSVPGLSLALISSRFLASAPFLSQSVCESTGHSPALGWAKESMSGWASYCNHWPIPQPPFGLRPPFPQLWVRSFISAEPGPKGHNDSGSLGLHPLSQLKLQKSRQIFLLLLAAALTLKCWHTLIMSAASTYSIGHSKKDVTFILVPWYQRC